MGTMIVAFLTFLLEHSDLVLAFMEAVEGAADPAAKKAELLKAIRDGQIAATNLAVAADLGPRPAS
jgi:hypothetical protein